MSFRGLTRLTNSLAAVSLAGMALVAFFDVLLRLLGKPVTGAYEATAILVALLVYSGLPGASAEDQHVRAGVFGSWLDRRPGLVRALRYLRNGTTAVVLLTLAWAMVMYAKRVGEAGDKAPYIELPLAWVAGFGALTLLLAALLAVKASAGLGSEKI